MSGSDFFGLMHCHRIFEVPRWLKKNFSLVNFSYALLMYGIMQLDDVTSVILCPALCPNTNHSLKPNNPMYFSIFWNKHYCKINVNFSICILWKINIISALHIIHQPHYSLNIAISHWIKPCRLATTSQPGQIYLFIQPIEESGFDKRVTLMILRQV